MTRSLKMRLGFFATAVCLAAWIVGGLGAQPNGEEPEGKAMFDRIEAAYQFIDLGRRVSSPEALLAGAVILHKNPVEELKSVEGAEPISITPLALLDEARKLRPADKALASYITELGFDFKEKSRGAVGGFRGTVLPVKPGETAKVTIPFAGRQTGMLWVGPAASISKTEYTTVQVLGADKKVITQKMGFRLPVTPLFDVTVMEGKNKVYSRMSAPIHTIGFTVPGGVFGGGSRPYEVSISNKMSEVAHVRVTSN